MSNHDYIFNIFYKSHVIILIVCSFFLIVNKDKININEAYKVMLSTYLYILLFLLLSYKPLTVTHNFVHLGSLLN